MSSDPETQNLDTHNDNPKTTPCFRRVKPTLTLSQNVGLHVAVVIFAGPDKSAGRLQDLGHHVIDETMFIPDLQLVKLWFVLPGGHGVTAAVSGALPTDQGVTTGPLGSV